MVCSDYRPGPMDRVLMAALGAAHRSALCTKSGGRARFNLPSNCSSEYSDIVTGKSARRENQKMNRKIATFSSHLLAVLVALAACSVDGQLNAQTPGREAFTQRHDPYFTVRGSIEMSRFERGGGAPPRSNLDISMESL